MTSKYTSLFNSRRFRATVIGIVLVIAKEYGLPISQEAVAWIVTSLLVWVGGDTLRKTE